MIMKKEEFQAYEEKYAPQIEEIRQSAQMRSTFLFSTRSL